MVAGQYPKREWRDNPDGQIRTIEKAVEIAKKHGVVIPDDITFHVDESGELHQCRRGGSLTRSRVEEEPRPHMLKETNVGCQPGGHTQDVGRHRYDWDIG